MLEDAELAGQDGQMTTADRMEGGAPGCRRGCLIGRLRLKHRP
jgi:hypothetical protein